MKNLINVAVLVLFHGCTSVSFADCPRLRLFRPFRTVQVAPMQVVSTQVVATPMANPAVCTCGPVCPCEQPANVVSAPTPFFTDRPVANVVAAPFLFFQETARTIQEVQPVRSVIKTITPPYCKDGSCSLR